MAFARTVVLEPAASEYLDAQIKKFERLKDVYRAWEWRLARQPEMGVTVSTIEPPRFAIKTPPYRQPVPCTMRILYRYTDDAVFIECIDVRCGDTHESI
jgi:hypothetical protein